MDNLVNQFSETMISNTRREPSGRLNDIAALQAFIEAGDYASGDRLPAERELIVELGISRSALRKALDSMERDGAIWRHVGKGTFVAGNNGQAGAGPWHS